MLKIESCKIIFFLSLFFQYVVLSIKGAERSKGRLFRRGLDEENELQSLKNILQVDSGKIISQSRTHKPSKHETFNDHCRPSIQDRSGGVAPCSEEEALGSTQLGLRSSASLVNNLDKIPVGDAQGKVSNMKENKPQVVPTPPQLSTENDESNVIREQSTALQGPVLIPYRRTLAEDIRLARESYDQNKDIRKKVFGEITPTGKSGGPFFVKYSGVDEERRDYFYATFYKLVENTLTQDETHICISRTIDLIPRWINISIFFLEARNSQDFCKSVLKMQKTVSANLKRRAKKWYRIRPKGSKVPAMADAVRYVIDKAKKTVQYLHDTAMLNPGNVAKLEDALTVELLALLDTSQTPWSRPQKFHEAVEVIDHGLGRLALIGEGEVPPALNFLNSEEMKDQREMSRALIWIATMEYNLNVPENLKNWLFLELNKLEKTNPILKQFKTFKSHLFWSLYNIYPKEFPDFFDRYLEDVASQTMIFIGDFTRRINSDLKVHQEDQIKINTFYQQVKIEHVIELVTFWESFRREQYNFPLEPEIPVPSLLESLGLQSAIN